MSKWSKKLYVLTRDGKYYSNTLFDCIEGYSCARETVKEFKDRFPNYKWNLIEYDPKLHNLSENE